MTAPAAAPKLRWTPHPVLALPTREQIAASYAKMGEEQAGAFWLKFHAEREAKIKLELHDPLRHGYDSPLYDRTKQILDEYDELLVLGANRLGKSRDAAKIVVDNLCSRKQVWAVFEASEKASINKQQSRIHDTLPPEWRDLGAASSETYVKYKRQNGFSGAQFILPNGSVCMFFNYKQDVKDLEGYELDGVWFDELVPIAFYEAMAFRVGRNRRQRMLITFTPLDGNKPAFTPVVAKFFAGARITETRPVAPQMHGTLKPDVVHVRDCPPGHMPFEMQCANPKARVLFYHWGMNPMGANNEVLDRLGGRPKEQWFVRAYGWVDKPLGSALPKFGNTHLITRAQFDAIAHRGTARYCVADPAGTKNWFIKWYAVTPAGHTIVYREWPDAQRYGPWAVPPEGGDKHDWRPGEAQRLDSGRGMDGYKRLILELEGWTHDPKTGAWDGSRSERIERRLIDPRLGGAGIPGQEEGTSIIDLMGNETLDAKGRLTLPRMFWEEAPGRHIQHGLQQLQTAMEWDESLPMDALNNCPKWYVVDDLIQTRTCYTSYIGPPMTSERDALKDIIDPDRYFIEAGYGFVEPEMFRTRGVCAY